MTTATQARPSTDVEVVEALAQEQNEQSPANVVWTLQNDSILITSIAYVRDKVVRHNQGKYANLSRYSLEGFVEYLLECGINAVDNAVDADIKRRNEAAYVDAMSKLQAPDTNLKPDAYAGALTTYMQTISALKRKFQIGGEQKQV